jgi:flagellar P-ring protein FlgI
MPARERQQQASGPALLQNFLIGFSSPLNLIERFQGRDAMKQTKDEHMNLRIAGLVLVIAAGLLSAQQNVRVKDVATITGLEEIQLFGYGLVVGLDGSGDKTPTVFTAQTIVNMLKNLGIELPEREIRTQNVAAVMATGTLKPFKRRGTLVDISVSSLGDATSLEGGTLIMTPLQGPDATVYASAQGAVSTGGYDVNNLGLAHIKKNHVLVGRIPDGAIVQKEYGMSMLDGKDLALSLANPDFTSALSLANAINDAFQRPLSSPLARAVDAATISINHDVFDRDTLHNRMSLVELIARIENLTFALDNIAKVVVNERTGTIVAGGDVKISEVAVSHGGVKIEIVNRPEAVQPQPFSLGKTEVIPNPETVVEEKEKDMVVLNSTTTVSDLAQALNSLGVTPRDVISILQAIKQAGALHAQLVVM